MFIQLLKEMFADATSVTQQFFAHPPPHTPEELDQLFDEIMEQAKNIGENMYEIDGILFKADKSIKRVSALSPDPEEDSSIHGEASSSERLNQLERLEPTLYEQIKLERTFGL